MHICTRPVQIDTDLLQKNLSKHILPKIMWGVGFSIEATAWK